MEGTAMARRWTSPVLVAALCAVGMHAQPGSLHAADVLTHRNDNTRSGVSADEATLTPQSVSSDRFGRLWNLYVDGQVTAQPLYISGLQVDTSANPQAPRVQGRFNVVIVATMHNTIYAYNADEARTGPDGRTVPLWATWLGRPRASGLAGRGKEDIDWFSTNDPEWGILSTPVVSEDKSTLYVVAWHHDDAAGLVYRLHALDMRSGLARLPPRQIGPSSEEPSKPCTQRASLNPCMHKQRMALLLSGGVIYVGFGGDISGLLYVFDAATLQQRAVWASNPGGGQGGLWQSGQGPTADAEGNVYVTTGNGKFDDAGNYGNSVVKLRLQGGSIAAADSFTPCNIKFLNDTDLDLGSSGPVLVRDQPSRLLVAGKEGVMYLLAPAALGGYRASPAAPNCRDDDSARGIQQFRAADQMLHGGKTHYGNIHSAPIYWRASDAARIYVWGENNPLKAFTYRDGRVQNPGSPVVSRYRPPLGMPGGMISLSARGNDPNSGVVWAAVPLDGDANKQRGVASIVVAADARDVSRTLWTSEQDPGRDRLGLFAKFVPPTVAGGKVFVATYGDREVLRSYPNWPGNPAAYPSELPKNYYVAVYGLRSAPTPVRAVTNQDSDDVTVVRAETSQVPLDRSQCVPIDGTSLDCTHALAATANAPSLHQVVMPAGQGGSGCTMLRVTVASKNAGLANATGIGFWSSPENNGNVVPDDTGRFVAKGQLKAVGNAKLRGNVQATLHEFVGIASCAAGGSGEVARLFKPYMEFEGDPGRVFHNWDRASNYRISPSAPRFDRSGDVLEP
jgi:outer membrane protein assembly factor BamB